MWPRIVLPAGEFGFVTARLEIVIRRYGVVVEPVLWQIVIFAAGVFVGAGVTFADGHAAAPTTTASPVWRIWARSVRPDCDFGLVIARLETVMRRHGFVSDPVLWQIVNLLGGVTVCVAGPWPCAATASPANDTDTAAAVAIIRRFTSLPPWLLSPSCSREAWMFSAATTTFSVPLQGFLCRSLTEPRPLLGV
jgi:hypothetical protein